MVGIATKLLRLPFATVAAVGLTFAGNVRTRRCERYGGARSEAE